MKRKILILLVIIVLFSNVVFADIVSYEGGVIGDPTMDDGVYEYSEYFFLTGEPILLTGTVEIEDIPDRDNYNIDYSFELSNQDENITFERDISYSVTNKKDPDASQTIYKADISDIDESITVDGVNYNLGSYLFDRSKLIDNTPAVDYYSGNLYFKKVYYINGDSVTNEGKIIHEMNSLTDIGYDHYWGDSETLVIEHKISAEVPSADDIINWNGYITTKNSSTDKRRFKYNETEPQNISFRGSYVKSNTMENIVQCTYDLPTVSDDSVDEYDRVDDEKNITKDVITNYESLISPKIKDIGGHWAEKEIFLLRSLGIFNNSNEYFAPDSQMNRMMFGKAIANSLANLEDGDLTDQIIRNRNQNDDEELFIDIEKDDPDYKYVEFLKNRKIMQGEYGYFKPYRPVTRAEAVKTMVNALGLEYLAPMPPYRTKFTDDKKIPKWAKDSVYVANEIGLVSGYPDGSFRPDKYLNKADATALIMAFIRHIKDNITIDYREKIINKY